MNDFACSLLVRGLLVAISRTNSSSQFLNYLFQDQQSKWDAESSRTNRNVQNYIEQEAEDEDDDKELPMVRVPIGL